MERTYDPTKRVSVKEASRRLDLSPRYIHIGLQQGILPFGFAVQSRPGGRFNYHISPKLLDEYIGEQEEDTA